MSILAIRSNRRQVGKQFQCLHISLCSRSMEVNLCVRVRTRRTTVTTCKCLIRRLPKQSLRLDSERRRYWAAIMRDRETSLRGEGEGVLYKRLQYGEATPRGPTPHPFCHFSRKRYHFRLPLSHNIHLLALFGPFTDPNDRLPYLHFNPWNHYPFIHLKPEKDTPFERSLPLWTIIGISPRG